MVELKLTNNPCKFCNGEIDEGKPLCGDIVNDGDVVNIVKTKEGYEIELWRNFELVNSEEIYFCPMCGRSIIKRLDERPQKEAKNEHTNDDYAYSKGEWV